MNSATEKDELYRKLYSSVTDIRLILELINAKKQRLMDLTDAGYAEVHAKATNGEELNMQNKKVNELFMEETREMGILIDRLTALSELNEPKADN